MGYSLQKSNWYQKLGQSFNAPGITRFGQLSLVSIFSRIRDQLPESVIITVNDHFMCTFPDIEQIINGDNNQFVCVDVALFDGSKFLLQEI